MKISLMRMLDYWLGRPLCFLFSAWNFIFRLPFATSKNNPPRKILFIKLSELGAIILAYPLINKIKTEYPQAKLYCLTFRKNEGVFKILGNIIPEENVIFIRDNSLVAFIFDVFKFLSRARREKVDIVFDLEFFSRCSAILAYFCGASKRIGFSRYTFEGLYRGRLVTHNIQYNPLAHISRNYLSMSQVVIDKKKNSPELSSAIKEEEFVFPDYLSNEQARQALLKKLNAAGVAFPAEIFLLNAGEGMLPLREWPLENFIEVSSKIINNEKKYLVLIGSDGAFKKAEEIFRAVNSYRCINLVGKTSLEELMELFCLSEGLISNDCGLAHLAMLTPIKKFIIFGPESPQVFGPLGKNNHIFYSGWPCSPCLSVLNHRSSLCRDNLCLKAIKADGVSRAILQQLSS